MCSILRKCQMPDRQRTENRRSILREAATVGFCEAVLCALHHGFSAHRTDEGFNLLNCIVTLELKGRWKGREGLAQLDCFRK